MRLEPLRDLFTAVGLPPHLLELWFTRTLRDGIALAATGDYAPFRQVAAHALRIVSGYQADAAGIAHVLAGLSELPAHRDVLPAASGRGGQGAGRGRGRRGVRADRTRPGTGGGAACPAAVGGGLPGRPHCRRLGTAELQYNLRRRHPGAAPGAELIVRTSSAFLDRWAAGVAGWDDGRARGEVIIEGPPAAWPRWLAATGYLPQVEPDPTQEEVLEEGRHD